MQERAGCCALRCPNRSAPETDTSARLVCRSWALPVEGRLGSGDPRLRNLRLHRLPIAKLYDLRSTALRSHKRYRPFERQLDTLAASSTTRQCHATVLSLSFVVGVGCSFHAQRIALDPAFKLQSLHSYRLKSGIWFGSSAQLDFTSVATFPVESILCAHVLCIIHY